MIECKNCGESFHSKNKKAKYCSGNCRLKAHRSIETPLLRKYPFVSDSAGNRIKTSKDLILMMLSEYEKLESNISAKIVDMKNNKAIIEPSTRQIEENTLIVSEILEKNKIDYRKEFESCEFPNDFKLLWEKIDKDSSLTQNEKKLWRIEFGVK